jgi:hypothetical protein
MSSRFTSVSGVCSKRPMSAIPAFGHQVMCTVIVVTVIIIKAYHVVLLLFYLKSPQGRKKRAHFSTPGR